MKNRMEVEMIKTRAIALSQTKLCGIKPKRQVLGNKAAKGYKILIKESGMDYQLVPPNNH